MALENSKKLLKKKRAMIYLLDFMFIVFTLMVVINFRSDYSSIVVIMALFLIIIITVRQYVFVEPFNRLVDYHNRLEVVENG